MSLLIAHAAATWFMIGLIWVVQLVHYPLFRLVGAGSFVDYEAAHTRRMGALLVVPASAEVALAALVFMFTPRGISRSLAFVSGLLLVAIWVVTATVQVRQHRRLGRCFGSKAHRDLVAGNWLRTVLWSGRGALAAVMLV